MRMGGLGGGIPLPVGGGIGGIVLFIIIIVVMNLMGGGGLGGALGGLGGGTGGQGGAVSSLDPGDDMQQFVNAVTVDVQSFWGERFQAAGKDYPETVTVLFEQGTQTSCGVASSANGTIYCPAHQKVNLDPGN